MNSENINIDIDAVQEVQGLSKGIWVAVIYFIGVFVVLYAVIWIFDKEALPGYPVHRYEGANWQWFASDSVESEPIDWYGYADYSLLESLDVDRRRWVVMDTIWYKRGVDSQRVKIYHQGEQIK